MSGSQVQGGQCCWLQALPLVQPAALPGALICRAGAQRFPLMLGVRGKLLSMKSEGLEVVFETLQGRSGPLLSLVERMWQEERAAAALGLALKKEAARRKHRDAVIAYEGLRTACTCDHQLLHKWTKWEPCVLPACKLCAQHYC